MTVTRATREHRLSMIAQIATQQASVVSTRQLRGAGWSRHQVKHEIGFGRWTEVAPEVVALQNAPLTREQRVWLGLLHAGPGSAVSHRTACELWGLTGWESESIDIITVKSRTVDPVPGIIFHETRRDYGPWVHPARRPAILNIDIAALLSAERQPMTKAGIGLLAACVQQRLTTADRLFTASTSISKLRHGHQLRLALWDIEGGAHSFAELDVAQKCRLAGLVPPQRQRIRYDASERKRYLDLEWVLADGTVVILEVDGSFHLRTEHWWRDMKRERRLVVGGPTVLRCSTIEVRLEFGEVVRDLLAIGVPRVRGAAA